MRRYDTGAPMRRRRARALARAEAVAKSVAAQVAATTAPAGLTEATPPPVPAPKPVGGRLGIVAQKTVFLEHFAQLGSIKRAAELTGIARSEHYRWMHDDADYPDRFRAAQLEAIEALEHEARRRACEGVERPVYQMGALVGTTREYSDQLLMFLLKGARPEVYRERVDHVVDATVVRVKTMSDAEINAALLAYAARAMSAARRD